MKFKRYPYKQKWWAGPACAVFFGLCAWMFWHKAHQAPRGLIINHAIELSPSGAQAFHWLLFVAALVFVALGLMVTALSFQQARYITLTSRAVSAPKNGFSKVAVEVPFDSITSLQVQAVQRQRFLHIHHRAGKLSIAQSMLPSQADFEELCQLVAAKAPSAP